MCCGWLSTSDEVIHDDEHARWLQAGKERAMMGARGWGKKIRNSRMAIRLALLCTTHAGARTIIIVLTCVFPP